MKRPRPSIGLLMAFVGVVAVDLAAARWCLFRDDALYANRAKLAAAAPQVLGLELAGFLAALTRGRARAFWLGFLLLGLPTFGSLLMALADPATETTTYVTPENGPTTSSTVVYRGGRATRAWASHDDLFGWAWSRLGLPEPTWSLTLVYGAAASLSGFVVPAGLGGLLARWIAGRRRMQPDGVDRCS